MLKTNMSIVNLNHQQSSSSLLQALVNQRPKSSQKSHSQKRVPSAKSTNNYQNQQNYKLVTSSLCSPIMNNKQEVSQRTNETLKPTDNSTGEPIQSQRVQEQYSEKKAAKKTSLIQRTIFGQSTLGIKQKTVKLTRHSRSSSKQEFQQIVVEESQSQPQQAVESEIENAEATQKLEQLISKYKNTSFFNQNQAQPLQLQQQQVPQIVLNITQPKEPQSISSTQQTLLSQASQTALQEQDINTVSYPQLSMTAQSLSSINKYVTRISRGTNFIPTKTTAGQVNTSINTKSTRKRMNSPLHAQRRSKENSMVSESLVSQRESKSKLRNLSGDKKFLPQKTQNKPPLPFPEFEYYMSFARFFHKDKQFENQIKSIFNNSQKTQQYFQEIYVDHLSQSYHALQFCKECQKPKLEDIKSKIVNLPPNKYQKTIVFDLDETLIHCQESNEDPSDVVLTIKFPTGETVEAGINIRPFCKEMLQLLSSKYEIIVFTASHECYAQKVLNYIDPDKKLIHHRFFRDRCIVIQDGLHIKDLRVIGNRNLNDIILVDNASYSFCFQLENGIPIIPFYDNPLDKELTYLTTYLSDLMKEQNIITKNSNYFRSLLYQSDLTIEQLIAKI